MLAILLGTLTSFITAIILIPLTIRYTSRKKIFDVPDNRRIHTKVTPSFGGVAIFGGFAFAAIVCIYATKWSQSLLLLSVLIIPFVVGLLDDLRHLRPSIKLLAQSITATLIFFFLDVRLTSFYGIFFDGNIPVIVSYIFTVATIIIITNSFNLIDGIDGLAGTFSIVALLFFGIWFYLADNFNYAVVSFTFLGGIVAFLRYNWEPSRIFMGDTGSLVIGTMLAVLTIQFLNSNLQLSDNPVKFQSSVSTVFCILIIPLVDTIRIIIIRLQKGISPFTADKRHIHHTLVRLGLSHKHAVLTLFSVHIYFISIAILFRNADQKYVLLIVLISAMFLSFILHRLSIRSVTDQQETKQVSYKDTM